MCFMILCLGEMRGTGLSLRPRVRAAHLQSAWCYLVLSDAQVPQEPWLWVLGAGPALDASIGLSVGLICNDHVCRNHHDRWFPNVFR